MENATDAMACVGANNGVAAWLDRVCNDVADLSVHLVGAAVLDRLHQAFVSLLDEVDARLGHIAQEVGLIQVSVEAIVVGSHVQIDNISILQRSRVWNAVADDLIDGRAAAPWEVIIVPRRRIRTLTDDVVMHYFVNFFCCHSNFNGSMSSIECFSGDATCFPKFDKVFIIDDRHFFVG